MSNERPEPAAYFTERLPAQFDRALREQERAVETAQRVLDGWKPRVSIEEGLCLTRDYFMQAMAKAAPDT